MKSLFQYLITVSISLLLSFNIALAKEYRVTIKGEPLKSASLASETGIKTTVSGIQAIIADKPEQIVLELQYFLPLEDARRNQTVVLNEINILSPEAKIYTGTKESDFEITTPIIIYRGNISETESINLSFTSNGSIGCLQIGGKEYLLKPNESEPFNRESQSHLLQEIKTPTCGDDWCKTDLSNIPDDIKRLMAKSDEPQLKSANFTPLTMEIAVETNYKTYESFGRDSVKTAAHLLSTIAGVSKIYEDQLNINLKVVYMKIWTTPNDPYTGNNSTFAGFAEILTALKSRWETGNIQINKDAVMFISSQLNGGMAFLDGLCTQNNSYFIGSDEVHLIAHELGHLFGCPHTHNCSWPAGPGGSLAPIDHCHYAIEGSCKVDDSINPEGTLMSYCPDRKDIFHPLVKNFIRARAELKTCIGQGSSNTYSLNGRVKFNEKGLPNVKVNAINIFGNTNSTLTDPDGNYQFKLPVATYMIKADLPDYMILPDEVMSDYITVSLAALDIANINFTARTITPDIHEPDNSLLNAREIPVDGTRQPHTIYEINDIDYLKFKAVAGNNYLIFWHGEKERLSPNITLIDSDGTTVISATQNSQYIEWTASYSGTFYLKISGQKGPYEISVSPNPFVKIETNLPPAYDQIVDWGDFDNDGVMDILMSNKYYYESNNTIFRNENAQFKKYETNEFFNARWNDINNDGLIDVVYGSQALLNNNLSWLKKIMTNNGIDAAYDFDYGDIDNDGDIDIIRQIKSPSDLKSAIEIYYNDNGIFNKVEIANLGSTNGRIKLIDFDSDGDNDIVYAGSGHNNFGNMNFGPDFMLLRNDNGNFIPAGVDIESLSDYPEFTFADYDSDGDLDIAISGKTESSLISKIYKNIDGKYIDINAPLIGCRYASLKWFDYDNDGDLDLLITGRVKNDIYFSDHNGYLHNIDSATKLYINKGKDEFEEAFFSSIFPQISGSFSCADIDNDNDLDLLFVGRDGNFETFSTLLRNEIETKNMPPSAPDNLIVKQSGDEYRLAWDPASDDKTPSSGLTYNVRIGTTPGGTDIVSPMSNLSSGKRMIVDFGNTSLLTYKIIKKLKPGTYYWSVQAIDNCFVSSNWSKEHLFTVANIVPIANAGSDQTINEGISINLDGSTSTDPDGSALTYQWTAPTGITLSSNTAAKPTFTAPEIIQDTQYTFSLVVSDGTASSTVDQVVITVKNVNKVPIANADSDQTVNEGAIVTLNGSISSDPDSDPLVFKWTAPKGIVLNNVAIAKPTFTAPEVKRDTTYTISLVVNDGTADSPPTTVKITVLNVVKVSANIIETPNFKVYPNPTTGEITIDLAKRRSLSNEITILNSIGAVVLRKKITDQDQVKLDLSNLNNGLFLIKLKENDQTYRNKLLIQK
jgi:hypothetical protein